MAEPASRQKRLFDDTVEAEGILAFFENLNLEKISKLLSPILVHEAVSIALGNLKSETQVLKIDLHIFLSNIFASKFLIRQKLLLQCESIRTILIKSTFLNLYRL